MTPDQAAAEMVAQLEATGGEPMAAAAVWLNRASQLAGYLAPGVMLKHELPAAKLEFDALAYTLAAEQLLTAARKERQDFLASMGHGS